jgi:hypothetical protein
VRAESWNHIVPLHSTRSDVERILGRCPEGYIPKVFPKCRYDLPTGQHVFILYSEKRCSLQEGHRYNVPKGVVRSIIFYPADDLILPQMPSEGFTKVEDPELAGVFHYTNLELGLYYVADGARLSTIYYLPSAQDRRKFECR